MGNCSAPDNIKPISEYIQNLKTDGCIFDAIQKIDDNDLSVYTDDNVNFDIEVYFNGRQANNGFFAVFSARIGPDGDFLVFETIQTWLDLVERAVRECGEGEPGRFGRVASRCTEWQGANRERPLYLTSDSINRLID